MTNKDKLLEMETRISELKEELRLLEKEHMILKHGEEYWDRHLVTLANEGFRDNEPLELGSHRWRTWRKS